MLHRILDRVLARTFLSGSWSVPDLVQRAAIALGHSWKWLPSTAQRFVHTFGGSIRPRQREVERFLRRDPGLAAAKREHRRRLNIHQWISEPQSMWPSTIPASASLPVITSAGALADWLWLDIGELEWFADLKQLCRRGIDSRTHHYHYKLLSKASGGVRLIEAPKRRLKKIQTEILEHVLDPVSSHSAAHGFVKGRSTKTFAVPHINREVVLRLDLKDFFASVRFERVQTIFRTLGYPESVATLLGGLCTNAVPRSVFSDPSGEHAAFFGRRHLPQGAPTSPILANICAYRLDCRLDGLAQSIGARYSRYADDLAFSGGPALGRQVPHFVAFVSSIVQEEGFRINPAKTQLMRKGTRQHLAGLVTNQKLNLRREDYDQLKATLHNCIQKGPRSQNREQRVDFRAHLQGKVAYAEYVNPEKGRKLRESFNQIVWD